MLDDERGLIVDAVCFADALQVAILPSRIVQDRVANLLRRALLMLTHYAFERQASFFVTPIIDAVGVKENNVSRDPTAPPDQRSYSSDIFGNLGERVLFQLLRIAVEFADAFRQLLRSHGVFVVHPAEGFLA